MDIFCDIEIIHARHRRLLNELQYLRDWSLVKQKGIAGVYVLCVCVYVCVCVLFLILSHTQHTTEVFTTEVDFLLLYKNYINNYSKAQATLHNLTLTHSDFAKVLRRCESNTLCVSHIVSHSQSLSLSLSFSLSLSLTFTNRAKRHDLGSFLIQPIQRIPRYRMLLEDMLTHTSDPIHLSHLRRAVANITHIAGFVFLSFFLFLLFSLFSYLYRLSQCTKEKSRA